MFSRLKYPDNLVNSTISRFVAAKASDQPVSSPAVSDRSDPIRVVLLFKDQASADIVRSQLKLRFKSEDPDDRTAGIC